MSSRVRADFHRHLDRCQQCANHPFELCSEGARLLALTAAETSPEQLAAGLVELAQGRAK
jgi:hypothetical protein